MRQNPDILQSRWIRLMEHLSIEENVKTFTALCKAYTEPHRAYHTLDHITACLKHLDAISGNADYPREIELALWFHDAIYKPFSKTNEEDSAEWAKTFMAETGMAPSKIDRVIQHIVMTKDHTVPETVDGRFMLDIDLSILGTPDEVYDQFEKDVRFEYKRVPGFLFRKKRKAILISFLNREKIYQSDYFRDRFEDQARSNLERTITNL